MEANVFHKEVYPLYACWLFQYVYSPYLIRLPNSNMPGE